MLLFHFTSRDGIKWVVPEHALLYIRASNNPNLCQVAVAPNELFFVEESYDALVKRLF